MQRLKNKASRLFKGKKEEEEAHDQKSKPVQNERTRIYDDRPRTARSTVAPWEAQNPPSVEQPPKLLKKKSSTFSLRKQQLGKEKEVHSDGSAPSVPQIPDKYKLFPTIKPNSPFDIPIPPLFAKESPGAGRSTSDSHAAPKVSPPIAPSKYIPLMTPYSEQGGLPKSPSKVTFAPSTESLASSIRQPASSPQSPFLETLATTRIDPVTGVPLAPEPTCPAEVAFREILLGRREPRASDELVVWPGIAISRLEKDPSLRRMPAITTLPHSTAKPDAEKKKPKSLPQSPSSYSLSTVTPISYHEHKVPHSAPLPPPSSYASHAASSSRKDFKSSLPSTPAYPEFAPLSQIGAPQTDRKSSSSSRRPASQGNGRVTSSLGSDSCLSSGTSSLGRRSGTGLRGKKSLRDLFKRSSSGPSEQGEISSITRPVLVPQPGPDSAVPPLPATVAFTKPQGSPPQRPERDETVDWELVALRGVIRVGFAGSVEPLESSGEVTMGMADGEGKRREQYRHSTEGRYVVERNGEVQVPYDHRAAPATCRGMAIRNRVTDSREWVADI